MILRGARAGLIGSHVVVVHHGANALLATVLLQHYDRDFLRGFDRRRDRFDFEGCSHFAVEEDSSVRWQVASPPIESSCCDSNAIRECLNLPVRVRLLDDGEGQDLKMRGVFDASRMARC